MKTEVDLSTGILVINEIREPLILETKLKDRLILKEEEKGTIIISILGSDKWYKTNIKEGIFEEI